MKSVTKVKTWILQQYFLTDEQCSHLFHIMQNIRDFFQLHAEIKMPSMRWVDVLEMLESKDSIFTDPHFLHVFEFFFQADQSRRTALFDDVCKSLVCVDKMRAAIVCATLEPHHVDRWPSDKSFHKKGYQTRTQITSTWPEGLQWIKSRVNADQLYAMVQEDHHGIQKVVEHMVKQFYDAIIQVLRERVHQRLYSWVLWCYQTTTGITKRAESSYAYPLETYFYDHGDMYQIAPYLRFRELSKWFPQLPTCIIQIILEFQFGTPGQFHQFRRTLEDYHDFGIPYDSRYQEIRQQINNHRWINSDI